MDFCLRRDIDRCRMDLRLGIFSFHLLLFPSLWVSQILAFVYWKLLKVVTLDFVCWHDTDALNIFVEMKMCVQNLLLLCELKVVWTCLAREIPPPVPPLAVKPRSSWQFPNQIFENNIFSRKTWIIILKPNPVTKCAKPRYETFHSIYPPLTSIKQIYHRKLSLKVFEAKHYLSLPKPLFYIH